MGLTYGIDSEPPGQILAFLGLQNVMTSFGSLIGMPLMIREAVCMYDTPMGNYLVAKMLSLGFIIGGFCTIIQVFFGIRLPIVQGGNIAFMSAILALLALPENECPAAPTVTADATIDDILYFNISGKQLTEEDIVNRNMSYIQGTVIIGGCMQVFLGITGLMGILLKFITRITLSLVVILLALSLFGVSGFVAGQCWPIALTTVILVILAANVFDLVTINVNLCGQTLKLSPFKLFPVLFSILTTWAVCIIFTLTGLFDGDFFQPAQARFDAQRFRESSFVFLPTPFSWGGTENVNFSVVAILGIMCGVLASTLESIGDYYACAAACEIASPPESAINRGIFTEGIGTIIGGIFGTGNGLTSYSENIGAIMITRVASRKVVLTQGGIMIFLGIFMKFSTMVTTIPGPIVGGIYCTMFGMIVGVGMSNLQHVDLGNPRNTMILGISMVLALAIPDWINKPANKAVIMDISSQQWLNNILVVLLGNGMFIGSLLGCFMDNLLPNRENKNGNSSIHNSVGSDGKGVGREIYDFPLKLPSILYKLPIFDGPSGTAKVVEAEAAEAESLRRHEVIPE